MGFEFDVIKPLVVPKLKLRNGKPAFVKILTVDGNTARVTNLEDKQGYDLDITEIVPLLQKAGALPNKCFSITRHPKQAGGLPHSFTISEIKPKVGK